MSNLPISGPSTFTGLRRQLNLESEINPRRNLSTLELKRQINTKSTPSSADFYIPSLPGQPSSSSLVLYGGHLPFSPLGSDTSPSDDSYGFFFLNKARHIANKPVLMVWLNGGPGCSSFDGAIMELGPLRMVLKGDGQLKEVDGAWNEYVNMLFIDQPTGTGYSVGSESNWPHELDVNLLLRFYAIFPEYQQMDLYLGGESFAGQYIPYLADAILKKSSFQAPLKGILIGNGWVDPVTQYLGYHEFAFQAGLITKSSPAAKTVMTAVEQYKVPIHLPACEGILSAITDSTVQTVNSQKMCLNMYDIRLVDTYPACGMTWPPDLADMKPYLSRKDVKKAFHADRKTDEWVECNGRVGSSFWTRSSRPSVTLLPGLLERLEVLLFSGDQDLICCHTGTEKMIDGLTWNGHQGWTSKSQFQQWKVNGTHAGQWRQDRNLTYALIANGSHMAPYDVPLVAQDMILRFLNLDVLDAAGPAANVSSGIGTEPETILHRVHLNNTLLETISSSESLPPSVPNTLGNTLSTDSNYYNASSAGIIIVMLGGALGLLFLWRRKLRRSGRGDFAQRPGPEITIHDDYSSHHLHPTNEGNGNGVKFMRVPSDDHLNEENERMKDDGEVELEELVVDRNLKKKGGEYYDSIEEGKL
ncbi:putative carboxypeptidase KEX1 precursor [Melampsora americana]|nr:putative carboxypeptidase KEX1 precursor [Melampsora americana]